MFVPFDKMWERVENDKNESDVSLCQCLMNFGEFALKIIVIALISLLENESERLRYRQEHKLVRANGLGDWANIAEEILVGPTSAAFPLSATDLRKEITQKLGPNTWQYDAVRLIHDALNTAISKSEGFPNKVSFIRWFSLFTELRNKAKGHGALKTSVQAALCPQLEQSFRLIQDNFCLFAKPWAYLHQNLSGKYRVVPITSDTACFDYLKSKKDVNLTSGVYLHSDKLVSLELFFTTADLTDFFLPNGAFKDKSHSFEVLSYISGDINNKDGRKYMIPPTSLPKSATAPGDSLDVRGGSFTNIAPPPKDYTHRKALESELTRRLLEDNHPIITLIGRGGIGKTCLALSVINELLNATRYEGILWFSARDIDLLPEGPKHVTPDILTITDIAWTFKCLMGDETEGNNLEYFARGLEDSPIGPTLFVFDNFETVRSPLDVFNFIDENIRVPNKVLITTRQREFRGDFPVEVTGMEDEECRELINGHAGKLGILNLINKKYVEELIQESNGHPYVIKVLLGELAIGGKARNLERVIASRDDILEALFDRTFMSISTGARRIFLTLSSWRSTVPQLALEAVVACNVKEHFIVDDAVDELEKCSFVEVEQSNADLTYFINVPLAASLYGRRQLEVSQFKPAIENDLHMLQWFGASQRNDLEQGLEPRLKRLFRRVAELINSDEIALEDVAQMLKYIARNYPKAWLYIKELYSEFGSESSIDEQKNSLRAYLQQAKGTEAQNAWKTMALLCKGEQDIEGEIHAWVQRSSISETPIFEISRSINRVNSLLHNPIYNNPEEKVFIIKAFINNIEKRRTEINATDYSGLAWLYIRLNDKDKALDCATRGRALDPSNEHCINFIEKFAGTEI